MIMRLAALAFALMTGNALADAPYRVGSTAGPYAEILEFAAKQALAKDKLQVQVVEFTDYTLPNEALSHGDIDASNFQNLPYLENAKATRGYDIVPVERSIVVPLGIYSKRVKSVADLPDGAELAMPNDPANGARSLLLFEQAGLITLKPGSGTHATVLDIASNPKHLRFHELDAAQVPRALDDVAAAALNLNYVLSSGLDPKTALVREDKDSVYGLWFTTLSKDRDDPRLRKLIAAYRSPEVKQFILDRFGGTIIPTW